MDDNLVLSLSFPRMTILLLIILPSLFLPLFDDPSNSGPKIPCLHPASVGQGRIVGSRRSEVPLFISLVKARAMSGNDHDCWLLAHIDE